jgi:ethanolamine utilization cobalamin adenosyltransferase
VVRLKAGRKLLIDDKTIVTPSARELGEDNKVFMQAGWEAKLPAIAEPAGLIVDPPELEW